jgi:hypothetical protein
MCQVGKYAPTAVRLGADPGTLGYMIFSEKRGIFEAEADIDIDRFFLVANYGISSYKLDEPTYLYENQGTYLRIGPDINFMHEDPNLNIMFFGLRYARSSFNDKLQYDTHAVIQSETTWPNTRETSSNGNAKASWYEMVTGLKIRIVKQLYMGFTMRFKLLMKTKQTEILKPYYIPGFGKNVSSSSFGFNYYISYRLPFRKKIVYTDEHKNVIEQ